MTVAQLAAAARPSFPQHCGKTPSFDYRACDNRVTVLYRCGKRVFHSIRVTIIKVSFYVKFLL